MKKTRKIEIEYRWGMNFKDILNWQNLHWKNYKMITRLKRKQYNQQNQFNKPITTIKCQ